MTKQEILDALREMLKTTQDWACYHSDEFGNHYAADMQPDIDRIEALIDGVGALHDTESVASWFDRVSAVVAHPWDANQVKAAWLEEMGT